MPTNIRRRIAPTGIRPVHNSVDIALVGVDILTVDALAASRVVGEVYGLSA